MRDLTSEKKGSVVLVTIDGDIEFDDSIQINEHLSQTIKNNSAKLVLDLERCGYIDSSGLGALVEGLKATQKAKGDLRLCNLSEDFKEILMMTRIIKYFQVFDSVDDAINSYAVAE